MTDYQTIRKLIHRLREADTEWQVTAQREMAERYREVLPEPVWQRLRSNHFNHAELELLDLVAAAGKRGIAYQEVQAEVLYSQSLVSRYTNRLAELGLLVKEHPEYDQKAYQLTVTPAGERMAVLHAELHRQESKFFDQRLTRWSPEEVATTIAVLKSLTREK
ncbi:transcriptional regulator [Limosilactobacillus fermentum]|uniref:transcriptional regulator n=1 Tax=Limosilactobacillus fermentum TaxID=1613 RepID=UPI00272F7E15|nr:transcriptional regulator [Limosilactobacillus fermentum]WLF74456.1 transcriptional regulator [Limosilactobacillus fermentum]